jgi:hypothetical protein
MPRFNARNNRFTQYDMLEAKGFFASNPANADSMDLNEGTPLYKGPVRYPMMFYHPQGEERVTVPAQQVTDSHGEPVIGRDGQIVMRGEQREIIWELAHDADDEEHLREGGWHDHPSDALAASGRPAPPKGAQAVMDAKDREIATLQAQLAKAQRAAERSAAPAKPKAQAALDSLA